LCITSISNYCASNKIDDDKRNAGLVTPECIERVTAAFPPGFVMTARGDFLVPQAKPFYERLRALGQDCSKNGAGTLCQIML